MNKRFHKEFFIDYLYINENLTTSIIRLIGYLQEVALLHANTSGYSANWFSKNQMAFLLTSWDVNVYSWPKWNEKITVYTWPVQFKGILGIRSFRILDQWGNSIADANSKWVFTDIKKHRPIKVPAEMIEHYGQTYDAFFASDFKMPTAENYRIVAENEIIVKRSNIDSNHHVNNVDYVLWAMDYLPEDLDKNKTVANIKVFYKKECMKNTKLLVETLEDPHNPLHFLTNIKSSEQQDLLYAAVHVILQNQESGL